MNLKKLTDLELDRMANDDMLEATNPDLYGEVMDEIEWRSQNNPLDIKSDDVMDFRRQLKDQHDSEEAHRRYMDDMLRDEDYYMDWYGELDLDLGPMY